MIEISIRRQRLHLFNTKGQLQADYPVSTALNGTGQAENSGCTPLGKHYVRAKIGQDCAANTSFIGRRPESEVYSPNLCNKQPSRDWILSRILWLCGTQKGFNRGQKVDSQRRYIYIHGTDQTHLLGQPVSHGCIRMAITDIIELFPNVPYYCPVIIHDT